MAKQETNLRKISKETPFFVGNAMGKPFISLGIEQTFMKDSKAKFVGLWVDDEIVAMNLSKAFKAAADYIRKEKSSDSN